MNPTVVAIIEDNADLLDDLVLNLSRRGMEPSAYVSGAEFDAAMEQGCPWRVLVLDLGLPGEDGLSIARRLRLSNPLMGIIMLTARGAVMDRIQGMEDGADLYLVKPVDMDELAAAIKTVARRIETLEDLTQAWRLDAVAMRLTSPNGDGIDLTLPETALLRSLAQNPHHFGERDALVTAMGKNPDAYDPRALEVTISRLRHKLGDDPPLKSVRARGYVFAASLILIANG